MKHESRNKGGYGRRIERDYGIRSANDCIIHFRTEWLRIQQLLERFGTGSGHCEHSAGSGSDAGSSPGAGSGPAPSHRLPAGLDAAHRVQ